MRPEHQQGGYTVQSVPACWVITISPASQCQLPKEGEIGKDIRYLDESNEGGKE